MRATFDEMGLDALIVIGGNGSLSIASMLYADFGLPIYGHTYFVNNDLVKKNPKLIERFLRATHKGWRDAKANPAASIDAMVEQVAGLDRNTLLATMPAILDLCVTERSAKHGLGWIEPELMQFGSPGTG